jgi:hypothetical protein
MKRSSAAVAGKSQLSVRVRNDGKHGKLPSSSLEVGVESGVSTAT